MICFEFTLNPKFFETGLQLQPLEVLVIRPSRTACLKFGSELGQYWVPIKIPNKYFNELLLGFYWNLYLEIDASQA